eukprot:scaffold64212_cov40-Attheya_sp.AAC.1
MIQFTKKRFLLALYVLATGAVALPDMDIVMRGGDVIEGMNENEFPHYRGGGCEIRFSKDGNLATQNGFNTGGWDANQNSFCSNYMSPDYPGTKYRLNKDGNLVGLCGDVTDYATHTSEELGSYYLGIDDDCILHIVRETELWTNIKREPLKAGDRLGKGEQVIFDNGDRLLLQSSDGNLVLYRNGHSAIWAANAKPEPSNDHDFFAIVSSKGHLILKGRAQHGKASTYYDLNLHSKGAKCFHVVYDESKDDLIAEPYTCNENRRVLLLRGSLV